MHRFAPVHINAHINTSVHKVVLSGEGPPLLSGQPPASIQSAGGFDNHGRNPTNTHTHMRLTTGITTGSYLRPKPYFLGTHSHPTCCSPCSLPFL